MTVSTAGVHLHRLQCTARYHSHAGNAILDLTPQKHSPGTETRRAAMRHQADGLLNTVLRAAATALIGAGASLLWFVGRARPERAARHRQAGLFLRRRRHRHQARRLADGRPHVCGIPGAAKAGPSVSGGDDPWRQPDRHELHRHARRARGLGAVFPAPRLRGLCGRPGGARPRGAVVAGERAGVGRQPGAP